MGMSDSSDMEMSDVIWEWVIVVTWEWVMWYGNDSTDMGMSNSSDMGMNDSNLTYYVLDVYFVQFMSWRLDWCCEVQSMITMEYVDITCA